MGGKGGNSGSTVGRDPVCVSPDLTRLHPRGRVGRTNAVGPAACRPALIGGDMLKALSSRLSYANVMATVAVFLALGGGAYALSGIPDRSGTFRGCASNATGALRVVKSASSCQKPKTVLRHGKRVRL